MRTSNLRHKQSTCGLHTDTGRVHTHIRTRTHTFVSAYVHNYFMCAYTEQITRFGTIQTSVGPVSVSDAHCVLLNHLCLPPSPYRMQIYAMTQSDVSLSFLISSCVSDTHNTHDSVANDCSSSRPQNIISSGSKQEALLFYPPTLFSIHTYIFKRSFLVPQRRTDKPIRSIHLHTPPFRWN